MKSLQRFLALALCVLFVLSVVGCKGPYADGAQPADDPAQAPAEGAAPAEGEAASQGATAYQDTITIGGVELNDAEKSVTVDGEPVQLTPIEYNILHLLMRNPNRVFSSTQIYELVWNENAFGSESAVAVHIRHLREKIEINPSEPRYIKVVWGQGYKMEGKK